MSNGIQRKPDSDRVNKKHKGNFINNTLNIRITKIPTIAICKIPAKLKVNPKTIRTNDLDHKTIQPDAKKPLNGVHEGQEFGKVQESVQIPLG